MTGRHARRRLTSSAAAKDKPAWQPDDEAGGDDFPVTAEDARRFAALAEEYRALAREADDPVTRRRLARAVKAYVSWAAKGPASARRSNG